jgi:hypothetical protein
LPAALRIGNSLSPGTANLIVRMGCDFRSSRKLARAIHASLRVRFTPSSPDFPARAAARSALTRLPTRASECANHESPALPGWHSPDFVAIIASFEAHFAFGGNAVSRIGENKRLRAWLRPHAILWTGALIRQVAAKAAAVLHDCRKARKAPRLNTFLRFRAVATNTENRDKRFPEVQIKASSATRHDGSSAGRLWKQEQDKEP